MGELLKSPVPKIGWNLKFEEWWTEAEFGFTVNNWIHDGMEATHVLDNRHNITGLKFQAFVQLGQDNYAKHIEPFLEAEGGNDLNQIDRIDLPDLLLYCGLDSLFERKISSMQRGRLNLPPF